MFDKILIANRGEIACRIIKTARRMGIKTVAVYSDADADGKHVRMADEAVRIGPPPSAESYLQIDRIVEACRQTGAQAVHPGFGFLSERAAFCEALEKAGIVFIGPGVNAIEAMGDKITSKKIAHEAGVSTVPGFLGTIEGPEHAARIAGEIGYPVMIKASAGGGGKGMRIANSEAELKDGVRGAMSEARSSFGDDRVFIEKFVTQPRHIEIQVLADGHGNVVHLGERECSIQRRHQKVIEEAPSPFIDAETRAAMGAQAVALAKQVGYRSAGTVEFIADANKNFYFLEMNTRLQVEHPVTEMVTGLDLVELMIRVAAGEKLPFGQDDIKMNGWAIEARVYAEDPYRGFLPSIGRLTRYEPPHDAEGIRVDDGVDEGSEISMFYDPMIAKLVAYGDTRDQAADRLYDAIGRYRIRGLGHNLPFLAATIAMKRFREGRLTTGFIAEEFPDGFSGAVLDRYEEGALCALAVAFERANAERMARISGQIAHRGKADLPTLWTVREGRENRRAEVREAEDGYDVTVDGQRYAVRGALDATIAVFDGMINGEPFAAQIDRDGIYYRLSYGGRELNALVVPPRIAGALDKMPPKESADTGKLLVSPMPGLLVSLAVAEGEAVKAGQELCVVEAMKMENVLRAERDGVVAKLHASPGDSLAVDQTIVEFE
ncbi:acetyl/propionyl-CoA carboxylase subuit alpha [Thalassobaculum fulvum]|uniref:propionyl-CoA carboxylase n=1 Tax=Thalassobaculum fulvum TaxID=1633335 RepID=A0A918XV88_9PROT|nr:acetyl/propionyl/methylcrotonyl-CoA carboxylase subunit alpha [Thalassobaculum fulvum]GHD58954.1 acetyl/propionyl-CoA carboxylase subuit alpha [Thalassobaculum fulvum]